MKEMKFSDTKYGDLTGKTYDGDIMVQDKITSLEGSPKIVKGGFRIAYAKIPSLKYGPEVVHGDYYFFSATLTSLQYCPKVIDGNFYAINKIKSLDYLPEIVKGKFNCEDNPLTQHEIDKLVKCDIHGRIQVPKGLNPPTKEDFELYKKLGDNKYFKLKQLKDKLL